MINDMPKNISATVAQEITNLIKEKETKKKQEIIEILKQADVSEDTVHEVEQKLNEWTLNDEKIQQLIENRLQVVFDQALNDVEITTEQQKQLEIGRAHV